MELQRAQPARLGDRLDVSGRMIPEHPDRCDERRQPADDRRDLLGRHEPRRVLDEDEAQRVGAGLDRVTRVGGVRDPTDLDPNHDSDSSRTFAATSSARTSASPTSTAWAPAATTGRTWSAVKKPLALTTSRPAGISGNNSTLVSMRVSKVLRFRLLMPMLAAPAAPALSSSEAVCASTSACRPSPVAACRSPRSSAASRIDTISRMASAPAARASHSWYSSSVKSLRSTGTDTRRRMAVRNSRLPWKYFSSVSTDSAAAPFAA